MRKGIHCSGNWVVDHIKFIDVYPEQGNLTSIREEQVHGGGAPFNVLLNIRALDSDFPLWGSGLVGNDREGQFLKEALECHLIESSGVGIVDDMPTSYTDVMVEKISGKRTFFHCRGCNSLLDEEHVLAAQNQARIFHLGYLLLLDKLDGGDQTFGTRAARLLSKMQASGVKTSIDVVSEEGNRYTSVVVPALKYVDFLIVNEIEASKIAQIPARFLDGSINLDALGKIAGQLLEFGVNELVVIHFPEGGFAMGKDAVPVHVPSVLLNQSEIVSSVGAGDAFCAGMLYSLHQEFPVKTALAVANTMASFNLKNATSTGGAVTIQKVFNQMGL